MYKSRSTSVLVGVSDSACVTLGGMSETQKQIVFTT
jgi:hypothetical protein